ncbi:hypothetical protein [Nostoc sp.]|uniref:hypothetical protein n=1 Tax=Nostoc sp. TaxID=1180 RepID=UPI002FFAD9DF
MSIPAPLYKIGQQVEWIDGDYPSVCEFTGIVTGQTYCIDYKGGIWKFTMAITGAIITGKLQPSYIGGNYPNVNEDRLRACVKHK